MLFCLICFKLDGALFTTFTEALKFSDCYFTNGLIVGINSCGRNDDNVCLRKLSMGNLDLIHNLFAEDISQVLFRMLFLALIISKCPNGYSAKTKECFSSLLVKVVAVMGTEAFGLHAECHARLTEEYFCDRCSLDSVDMSKKLQSNVCGMFGRIKTAISGDFIVVRELMELIKRLMK